MQLCHPPSPFPFRVDFDRLDFSICQVLPKKAVKNEKWTVCRLCQKTWVHQGLPEWLDQAQLQSDDCHWKPRLSEPAPWQTHRHTVFIHSTHPHTYIHTNTHNFKWNITGTSVTLQQSRVTRKKQRRGVLSFDLKTCKVPDDVTPDSRLFHVFAVATRNAQLPILWNSVGGTSLQNKLRSNKCNRSVYYVCIFIKHNKHQ